MVISIVYNSIEEKLIIERCIFGYCQSKMPKEKHQIFSSFFFFCCHQHVWYFLPDRQQHKKCVLNKYFISVFLFYIGVMDFLFQKRLLLFPQNHLNIGKTKTQFSSNFSSSIYSKEGHVLLHFPTTCQCGFFISNLNFRSRIMYNFIFLVLH